MAAFLWPLNHNLDLLDYRLALDSPVSAILVVLVHQYAQGSLVTWTRSKRGNGCLTGNEAGCS